MQSTIPFMLQMSSLDDKQFLFLAVNCHKQCQWTMISEKTKEDALDSFLVGRQGCNTEYMALAVLKTGLAYRGAYYYPSRLYKNNGEAIHWTAQ
jgi:hypothetical protein